MKLNYDSVLDPCLSALTGEYLFEETRRKIKESGKKIHDLSVGDVTLPIAITAAEAISRAAAELTHEATFRGYPPVNGYAFLREAIAREYLFLGASIGSDEIIITHGAKEALYLISSILSNLPAVLPRASYPVYRELSLLKNRKIIYCDRPQEVVERSLIFICSPDNPTGMVKTVSELKAIVTFARASGSLIIFDAAYSAFVGEGKIKSIFEIDGAADCAIEIGSFSKSSGFTGVRCGWLVIPVEKIRSSAVRLLSVCSNGVSYLSQRAALASLGDEGKKAQREMIAHYLENARIIRGSLCLCGARFSGGEDSPYIFLTLPSGVSGRAFFDYMLKNYSLAVTPGEGFGEGGKGKARLSCFCSREDAVYAAQTIPKALTDLSNIDKSAILV